MECVEHAVRYKKYVYMYVFREREREGRRERDRRKEGGANLSKY